MANLNKVILAGNLTRDPELRFTPSGLGVGNFSLAINTIMGRDENNQLKTEVLFIDVVSFGKQAETICNYLKKGSNILIEGRLRLRSWEDKNGNKRSKHEVIISGFQFLGSSNKTVENIEESGVEDEDVPF